MLKVAPALAAGCSAVLKPAEETPLTALKLEEIFREAGLPDGVLNVVTGYGHTTGAALTAHPGVDKISFTGSTEVGKLIVQAAAGNLKRLTLELGGKSPLIIFDDADLEKAIMLGGMGLLAGSGQNCCCTSRIYVQRPVYEQVVEGLVGLAQMIPMGGSEEPDSIIGPLISEKQRQRVQGIVKDGIAGGAQVMTGGDAMDRKGYFYQATIITNTTPDMRLIREEIFGPVGCCDPVRRRGRGDRRRQRHGLRARRRLMDRKPRPRPPRWRTNCAPARSGSTVQSQRTPRCRSAATSSPVGVASVAARASKSTSTPRRSTSSTDLRGQRGWVFRRLGRRVDATDYEPAYRLCSLASVDSIPVTLNLVAPIKW